MLEIKGMKAELFLAMPDKTTIAKLKNINGLIYTNSAKDTNNLSFDIPTHINKHQEIIENPHFKKMKERYLIRVEFNNKHEWMIINSINKSAEDTGHAKVSCASMEDQLRRLPLIEYERVGANLLEVSEDVLKGTTWSVGYINPKYNLMRRSFEVSSTNKLAFIKDELVDTFDDLMVTFDPDKMLVNFYDKDELSEYKGFIMKRGKYIKNIEDIIDADEIITRLYVYGENGLQINSANPTGLPYLDDFSYFLYPFDTDKNGKITSHSNYMSDKLALSLTRYNKSITDKKNDFSDFLSTTTKLQKERTDIYNKWYELDVEKQIILDAINAAKKTNMSQSQMIKDRDKKNKELTAQKKLLDAKDKQIKEVEKKIKKLKDSLQIENFIEPEELVELSNFIQYEEWTDDNKYDASDLYDSALEYFKDKNKPPINVTMDIVNFFEMIEEKHNWGRLSVHDIVKVDYGLLGIDVKTTISELVYDFDNQDITVEISNTERNDSSLEKIVNALYKVGDRLTDFDKRKVNWDKTAYNFNVRNDRIEDIPTTPTLTKTPYKIESNDNGSINIELEWGFPDHEKTKKDADNVDGFLIYLYYDKDKTPYQFGAKQGKEDIINIPLQRKNHIITSVPSNLYYTIGVRSYRSVDSDINSLGILKSDFLYLNQPSNNIPRSQPSLFNLQENLQKSVDKTNRISMRNTPSLLNSTFTSEPVFFNNKTIEAPEQTVPYYPIRHSGEINFKNVRVNGVKIGLTKEDVMNNPFKGDFWIDAETGQTHVFNGDEWVKDEELAELKYKIEIDNRELLEEQARLKEVLEELEKTLTETKEELDTELEESRELVETETARAIEETMIPESEFAPEAPSPSGLWKDTGQVPSRMMIWDEQHSEWLPLAPLEEDIKNEMKKNRDEAEYVAKQYSKIEVLKTREKIKTELNERIGDVQGKIDSLDNLAEELKKEAQEIEEYIANLENTIGKDKLEIAEDLKNLNQTANDLAEQAKTIDAELATQKNSVENLLKDVSNKVDAEWVNGQLVSKVSKKDYELERQEIIDGLFDKVDQIEHDTQIKDLTDDLASKVDAEFVDGKLIGKLDKNEYELERQEIIDDLLNKADTTDIEEKLKDKIGQFDFDTKVGELVEDIDTKAEVEYVDGQLSSKVDLDEYTLKQKEISDSLKDKIEAAYVDTKLKDKVNQADYDLKIDELVKNVADKIDSEYLDGQLVGKVDQTDYDLAIKDIIADIVDKADVTYVDGQLVGKVSQDEYDTKIDTIVKDITNKVDAEFVDGKLTSKVNQADYDLERQEIIDDLLNKVDTTEVEEKLKDKIGRFDFDTKVGELVGNISEKADIKYVDGELVGKANQDTTYTIEDVNNELDKRVAKVDYKTDQEGIVTRLKANESSITQQANQIESKVSQSEYDADINDGETGLKKKLTEAESSIKQNADNITSKVAQTEFDAVDKRVKDAESSIVQNATDITSKVSQIEFDAIEGRVGDAESSITQNATDITSKVAQTEFDLVEGRVKGAESSIKQQADQIKSKVSQTEFDEVEKRVGSTESSITQQAGQIKSKVSQTEFDEVEKRVGSTESSITQQAGQIKSKVAQTDYDKDINNPKTGLKKKIADAESSITQQAGLIESKVGKTEYELDQDDIITDLTSQESRITQTEKDITSKVSSTKYNADKKASDAIISGHTTEINQNSEAILSKADSTYVDAEVGRVEEHASTVEQTAKGIRTDVTAIQTEQSAQSKTIGEHSSSITQNAKDIKAKVNSSEYETDKDGIIKNIEANQTLIEANSKGIELRVTKDEFNSLEIGGRNLLLKSSIPYKFPLATGNSHYWIAYKSLNKNTTYSFSSNVEVIDGDTEHITIYPYLSSSQRMGTIHLPIINGKVEGTFSTDGEHEYNLLIYNGKSGQTTGSRVTLSEYKLEKGSKVTDWSPAPEDTAERIAKNEAAITVNADNITSKVEQMEFDLVEGRVKSAESSIKQQAGQIKSKVEQADFDKVEGRLGNAESTITQQAGLIESKVGKTEYELDMDDVVTDITNQEARITQTEKDITSKVSNTKYNKDKKDSDAILAEHTTSINQNATDITSKAEKTTVDDVTGRVDKAESAITQNATAIESKVEQLEFDGISKQVTDNTSSITQQAGMIESKVSQTEYDSDINNTKTGLKGKMTKAEAAITQQAGQIKSKVSQTDFDKAENRLSGAESTITQQANQIKSKVSQDDFDLVEGRVGDTESSIIQQAGQIASKVAQTEYDLDLNDPKTGLKHKVSEAESSITQNAKDITSKVSQTEYDTNNKGIIDRFKNNESSITQNADNITSKVSQAEYDTDINHSTNGLKKKLSDAESSITQNAKNITSKVAQTTYDKDINHKTNGLKNKVSQAESSITQQAGQIASKVEKTDFDKVEGRVKNAESSIVQQANQIKSKVEQTEFDTVKGRVDTAESSITQNATDIGLRVEKTEYNKNKAGVAQDIIANKSAITAASDEIKLRVTKDELQQGIDGIEVGGRNLVPNSGNFPVDGETWSTYTGGRNVTIVDRKMIFIPDGSSSNPRLRIPKLFSLTDKKEEYMVSIEYISENTDIRMGGKTSSSDEYPNESGGQSVGSFTLINTEKYKKNHQKKTWKWLSLPRTEQALASWLTIGVGRDYTFTLINLKIEKGNKATEWTPAPEDIDDRLTSTEAEIKVNADNIASKVAQSEFNKVEGRVKSAESTISQQAGLIESKVARTDYAVDQNKVISDLSSQESRISQTERDITSKVSNTKYDADKKASDALISNHTTEINQNATAITSKADKTYVDSEVGKTNKSVSEVKQTAEEISSKVGAVETEQTKQGAKISSAESNITQNAKDIGLRVQSTEYNKDKAGLVKDIAANKASISASDREIALRVTKDEFKQGIDDINGKLSDEALTKKLGFENINKSYERNLNPKVRPFTNKSGYQIVGQEDGLNAIYQDSYSILYTQNVINSSGTFHYFEYEVKYEDNLNGTVYAQLIFANEDGTSAGVNNLAQNFIGSERVTKLNEWQKFSGFISSETFNENRKNAHYVGVRIMGRYATSNAKPYYFRNISWKQIGSQEAHELQERVASTEAEIKINADNITSKVAQTDFNKVEGRVKTAESTISQHSGQIASKVSKTDYNVDQADVIGRLSSAESSITQTEKDITSKVSNTKYNSDKKASDALISDHTTKITQNANAIKSKAEKTYVDSETGKVDSRVSEVVQTAEQISSKVGTLETKQTAQGTKISNAESNITQNAKDIGLRVQSTEYVKDKQDINKNIQANKAAIDLSDKQIALRVTKDEHIEDIQGTKDYVQSRGENLVTNGTGLLGDNTNFSKFVFDGSESYAGGGSFYTDNKGGSVWADEYIAVNPNSRYRMSLMAKSKTGLGKNYFAVRSYDIDKLSISTTHFYGSKFKPVKLTKELKKGDMVIHLSDVSQFRDDNIAPNHYHSLVMWGYKNKNGYKYPTGTYSRLVFTSGWDKGAIDRVNNTITLNKPFDVVNPNLSSGNFKVGHELSPTHSGGSYQYMAASNVNVPTEWKNYEGEIQGYGISANKFPQGTAFVQLLFLVNRATSGGIAGDSLWLNAIEFTDISMENNSKIHTDNIAKSHQNQINDVVQRTAKTEASIKVNSDSIEQKAEKTELTKKVDTTVYNKKVGELTTSVNGVTATANSTKAIVDKDTKKVAKLEKDTSALNVRANAIESNVTSITEGVNGLTEDVGNLTVESDRIAAEVTSVTKDLDGKITDNKSSITQTAKTINQRITDINADYVKDKTGILSGIQKNTSAIDSSAKEIALRVTNEEFKQGIDDIQIGGRNLLKNTKNGIFMINNNSRVDPNTVEELPNYHRTKRDVGSKRLSLYTNHYYKIEDDNNNPYTLSVKVNPEVDANISLTGSSSVFCPKDTWTTITRTYVPKGTNDSEQRALGIMSNDIPVDKWIKYKEYKVEKGNKATDWSPAPEDTAERIAKTEADIVINKDAIALKASQASVDKKVDSSVYNEKIGKLDVSINGITGRVTNNKSEIDKHTGEIKTAQSDISSVEQTAAGIKSQVSSLDSDMTKANKAISSIDQKADSITSTVSGVRTDVGKLQNQTTIHDTRDDNEPPSYYWDKYNKETVYEFKRTKTLGLSGTTYGILETVIPWSDPSGGSIKQIFSLEDKAYRREGTSTSWGKWNETETTEGAQKRVKDAIDPLTGRMTKAESEIKQTPDRIDLAVKEGVEELESKVGNLVKNPEITGDHDGWSSGSVTSVEDTFEGESIKVLRNTATTNAITYSEYFDVDPSKAYEVSMWVRKNAARGIEYLGLHAIDSSGSRTGVTSVTSSSGSASHTTNFYFHSGVKSSTDWVKLVGYIMPTGTDPETMVNLGTTSRSAIMKPNTKRIRLRWLNYSNGGTTTYMYVAMPKVVESNGESVNKTNVLSSVNLSKEGVKIQGAKIDIAGLVTVLNADGTAGTMINGSKLINKTVTTNELNVFQIFSSSAVIAEIQSGSIKTAKLDAGQIATGTLLAERIGAKTITVDKLNVDNIFGNSAVIQKIKTDIVQATSIDAGKITTGTLLAERIGAKTITVDKLNVDNIFGNSAVIAKIKTDIVQATLIDASKITTGTLNANNVNVVNLKAESIQGGSFAGQKFTGGVFEGSDFRNISDIGKGVTISDGRINIFDLFIKQTSISLEDGVFKSENLDQSNKETVEISSGEIVFKYYVKDNPMPQFFPDGWNEGIRISGNTISHKGQLVLKSTFESLGVRIDGGLSVRKGISAGEIRSDGASIILRSDKTGSLIQSNTVYNRTYSSASNMYVTGYGTIGRTTSASKYKLCIKPIKTESYADRLLELDIKSWYDKSASEQYAQYLTDKFKNKATSLKDEGIPRLKTHLGLIAEDVEGVGLGEFVTYNDDSGEIEGIEYDRLWTLMIPIVKDQRDQIRELYREIAILKAQNKAK